MKVDLQPDAIRGVVFDMGGVFVVPHPDPIGVVLAQAGLEPVHDDDQVRRAHYHGVRALSDHLAVGDFHEHDLDVWTLYDQAYFAQLGVTRELLADVCSGRHRQRVERSGNAWNYPLTENIAAFHRLADSALEMAIVTNNDGTAEAQLIDLGICQLGPGDHPEVLAVVDSTVVGVAKPDPSIFQPALAALAARGVEPHEALYVGDTVHADVRGATAAGMPVVQLDPYDLHGDFDHPRLPDVVALADLLLGAPEE